MKTKITVRSNFPSKPNSINKADFTFNIIFTSVARLSTFLRPYTKSIQVRSNYIWKRVHTHTDYINIYTDNAQQALTSVLLTFKSLTGFAHNRSKREFELFGRSAQQILKRGNPPPPLPLPLAKDNC